MKKCCWGERPQKSPTCQQIGRAYLSGCITVSSNLSIHSVRSHRGGSIPHQCLNPIVLWLHTRLPFHLTSRPSRERVCTALNPRQYRLSTKSPLRSALSFRHFHQHEARSVIRPFPLSYSGECAQNFPQLLLGYL